MGIMVWLMVFIGGGLGSICRYGLGRLLSPYTLHFPWATLAANLIACILLGFIISRIDIKSYPLAAFWIARFCGGFSTFSTFTLENYKLLSEGQIWLFIAYVALSLIACLLGFIIGMKIV